MLILSALWFVGGLGLLNYFINKLSTLWITCCIEKIYYDIRHYFKRYDIVRCISCRLWRNLL